MRRPAALFVDGFRAARLRVAGLQFALAVGLGTVGGAIFFALALPLPWMLGAMTVATGAALAGAPIMVPAQVRNVMIAILGVLLGSQFYHRPLRPDCRVVRGALGRGALHGAGGGPGLCRIPQARWLRPGVSLLLVDAGRPQRDDGAGREHGRRRAHDLAHPRHAHPRRCLPDRLLFPAGRGGCSSGPAGARRRDGRLDRHPRADRLCAGGLPGGEGAQGAGGAAGGADGC